MAVCPDQREPVLGVNPRYTLKNLEMKSCYLSPKNVPEGSVPVRVREIQHHVRLLLSLSE